MTCVVSFSQKNKEIEKLKNECSFISLKDFDKSIVLAGKGAELSLKEKDSVSYAFFERFLGTSYYFKGDYNNAAIYYFKSIRVLEKNINKRELGLSYNELAKLYRKTKKLDLAEENYNKALNIFIELKDSANISTINNESGVVYEYKKNYEEALRRYTISYQISEKLNDSIAISYALNNIAGLYSIETKFNVAQIYLMKALEIRKHLKDSFALALNYTDLGSNSLSSGDFNTALEYLDSSNTIAKKLNYLELQSQNYLMISKTYDMSENLNQAYQYFKIYISLKDSIFTKESENQLNELNTKYQTEKKDLELAKNKAEIEIEKNKSYITYGALAFFMVLFSIAIWAFNQKKKSAKLLENKNNLLENANQEISHQKEQLDEKQKEIVDSINYAKKIQTALLASEEMLLGNLINHFILFKPKDIVSGDFTWATKKNDLFYIACCDSTGHGVPGAFMSLLNIGFLSEAIKERSILKPGEIFNYVRDRLIETIGKDEQQDGFDGIILRIDLKNNLITYAAANNSPLIIRDNELIQLSCNKMPVGKGIKTDSFDTFTLNYQKNDSLYLFTDGYPDQFGGPKGKKFKYKQLEELLLKNESLSLNLQKEKLNTTFEDWQGNLEQVDDVCIIGIKL
jgi:serine phosphatase RsbU (regulator of sigma subunit)